MNSSLGRLGHQGGGHGRRRGLAPPSAHQPVPQAARPGGRDPGHRAHPPAAARPRHHPGDPHPAVPGRRDPQPPRRRLRPRHGDRVRRRGPPAGHGGERPQRRPPARRHLPGHQRRRPHRHRPHLGASPSTGGARATPASCSRACPTRSSTAWWSPRPTAGCNRFLEKPSWGEVFSDHANTGIYVIEPSVLEHIEPDVVRRLVAGRLPADAAPQGAALRDRRRGLLVRHRLHPVVHAGQLGRARGPRALPHPGSPRGQRLDRRRRRVRHRRAARGPGVHRRRGQAQGGRLHQRPRRHRQVRDHRRQRQGLQHGDLAALLHRRELPPAPEHRLPQRHHQERQPARGEHRHR